jgi:hypothetical protein
LLGFDDLVLIRSVIYHLPKFWCHPILPKRFFNKTLIVNFLSSNSVELLLNNHMKNDYNLAL